jgi:glycosyltransferase involved in cell wall biosynthesis
VRERIRVIPNGVALAPARETRLEWRRRLGATADTVVVTSVAHFYPRKDHETLLQAWRHVLDAAEGSRDRLTLVLAGRPESRRERLEGLARDLGVDGRVSFAGDVEDVAGLLAASDVGVLSAPTVGAEGCSNAVLEMMGSGLPVAASDVPGIREVLGPDAGALLVPPGDADRLGSALGRLCADHALRARVGQSNMSRQSALFGRERMLEDSVAAILDGLAARRTRPPVA